MPIQVQYGDEILQFPDGMTEEQMTAALQQLDQQRGANDTVAENALDVGGEFASAANRAILGGLDYIGPGAINAGLRLAGSDYQLPTLTGTFMENAPGAEGGFMEPGTARDVVQAAGQSVPLAAGLTPVQGRNLANLSGAAAEWMGLGTQAPVAQIGSQAQDLISRADQIGFPLSPGERAGSEGMKRFESAIQSTPMPFNPMHRMTRQRQDLMNQVAAESIGVPGQTRLTQETMGDVADNLSAEFQRLGAENDLIVTEEFTDRLADIEAGARKRIFSDDAQVEKAIDGVIDRIGESGRLSAVDYQDISSEFKKKIRTAYRGDSPDPQFAETLGDIVSALDDLAENNMDGAALARLREARRKWRAFSALEKSRSVKESGDVSGPLLANYLRRTDKGGYARGKNKSDVYETARMMKAFPGQPDSGTASRMMLQSILSHPFAYGTGTAGAAGLLGMADPMYMLPAAAAAVGVPALSNLYFAGAPALQGVGVRPGALLATRGALED